MSQTIRHSVHVGRSAAEAFAVFAEELGRWWPPEYTWSGSVLEAIGIETREGGLCYEVGPHGFRCDWGRVLQWEPPQSLTLAWQIGPGREPVPDPSRASRVHVRFDEESPGRTRVTLEHRDFERHGDGSEEYRAALATPEGWPYILQRFATAAEPAS